MSRISALWALWLLLASGLALAEDAAPRAALIEIDGAIGPATSGYVEKAHRKALDSGARLIVLRVDTPGGLDTSMRDIIKLIVNSPVPVVGYVAPGGARAASAGTYILYACHVAAMAPATNLGAATPIPVGGGSWPAPPGKDEDRKPKDEDKDKDGKGKDAGSEAEAAKPAPDAMQRKVINDAIAYIRSLAEKRGRNADWAEKAVSEGASLSAEKALEQKVVDLVAADVGDLLKQIDGREVETTAGKVRLQTAGLALDRIEPDWRMRFLSIITNPTVAYVLMLIGIYGLLLEGYHPGAILPGVVGAICLLLALFAFQILPVNYVGLGLIILGVVLMIAEAMMPSFGALGFGGVVAFVFGSIMLMDIDVPGYGVNLGIVVGIAVGACALLALTLYLLWNARRAPVVTGGASLIGQRAEITEPIQGEGWAWVAGERWRVRTRQPVQPGERLRVVAMEGLVLVVEPESK
ncbi:MAG: nodulation protein NfeD [Gammaproteobacteria bacterium]|nr:nodulation protein NfeD [Gammaproteobacteria bacterium]